MESKINVKSKGGNRYGDFRIDGVVGKMPNQAMTSTNWNHAIYAKVPSFDFKTSVLVVIEKDPKRLLSDIGYLRRRVKVVRDTLAKNTDKICILELNGSKSMKITKDVNVALIKFQILCGFKFIVTFFKYVRNAEANMKSYLGMMPSGTTLVPAVDLNLDHDTFKLLYELSVKHKLPIIAFLGRKLSKSKSNRDNQLNFMFVSRRKDDRIIRLVLSISKSDDGIVSSLVYRWFGFDVFSFRTRYGNPNIPEFKLQALKNLRFVQLENNRDLTCVLTGNSLVESSLDFERRIRKSSLPVSIHDIVRLNEELETLHDRYTEQELAVLLGDRIKI